MKILVDADGCPVVDIAIEVGKKFNIEVILMCDTAHILNRKDAKVIVLGKGNDAVDFYLINKVCKDDVIITQDYGLAAMVLAKGGHAINQNGWIYSNENIDQLLFTRHISKKARNSGRKIKGPKKRTKDDNMKFESGLGGLCEKVLHINRKYL